MVSSTLANNAILELPANVSGNSTAVKRETVNSSLPTSFADLSLVLVISPTTASPAELKLVAPLELVLLVTLQLALLVSQPPESKELALPEPLVLPPPASPNEILLSFSVFVHAP